MSDAGPASTGSEVIDAAVRRARDLLRQLAAPAADQRAQAAEEWKSLWDVLTRPSHLRQDEARSRPQAADGGVDSPAASVSPPTVASEAARLTPGADSIIESEPAEGWIAPPAPSHVRDLLNSWAQEKRGVKDDLFEDAGIELSHAAIATFKIERLIEARSEEIIRAASNGMPATSEYLGALDDLATDPEPACATHEGSWEGIRTDSITESACEECAGQGQLGCGGCRGSGVVGCAEWERCPRCAGFGQVKPLLSGGQWVPCRACGTTGSIRCRRCGGRGQHQCSRCGGSGAVACDPCGQTGQTATFTVGRIERRIETAELQTKEDPAIELEVDTEDWEYLGTVEGQDVPAWIPERLHPPLKAELAKEPEGEITRRVGIHVVPIVVAEYGKPPRQRTAYLYGRNQRVEAPGATRLGRLFR